MPGWLTNGLDTVAPADYTSASDGASRVPADTYASNGTSPQSESFPISAFGGAGNWSIVSAAGASQGNATSLTGFKNLITVATTASTHGVKLPTAATGLAIVVANNGTFGVKVYPASGGQIQAVATNGADGTVLAINKVNVYHAVSGTKWVVQRGS